VDRGWVTSWPTLSIRLSSSPTWCSAARRRRRLDQDYVHHLTLLAFSGGDEGKVVGGAQYVVIDEHRAEVSFSDVDKLQGRGLGSLLLAEDYPSTPWVRIPHPPLLAVPRALGGFKGKGPLAGPFPH